MSRLFPALRTLVYGSAFLAFWGWVSLQLRPLDDVLGTGLPGACRAAGTVLLAMGAVQVVLSAGSFVLEGRGTPAPFDAPREFVVVGPYRWVRNPMYIGGLFLLAGFGLWHRSATMTLFALAWCGLAHLFVVFYEEPRLESRFGERYRAYRREVNRWIPRRPHG